MGAEIHPIPSIIPYYDEFILILLLVRQCVVTLNKIPYKKTVLHHQPATHRPSQDNGPHPSCVRCDAIGDDGDHQPEYNIHRDKTRPKYGPFPTAVLPILSPWLTGWLAGLLPYHMHVCRFIREPRWPPQQNPTKPIQPSIHRPQTKLDYNCSNNSRKVNSVAVSVGDTQTATLNRFNFCVCRRRLWICVAKKPLGTHKHTHALFRDVQQLLQTLRAANPDTTTTTTTANLHHVD